MRGFLYEIAKEVADLHQIYADEITNTYGGSEFSWSEDVKDEMPIIDLLDCLKVQGAETGVDECSNHFFVLKQCVKESFFRKSYEEFKKMADNMTLEEFSNSDLYRFQELIECRFSDAAYLHGHGFLTIDRFIREAEPGVMYRIGNVIGMH